MKKNLVTLTVKEFNQFIRIGTPIWYWIGPTPIKSKTIARAFTRHGVDYIHVAGSNQTMRLDSVSLVEPCPRCGGVGLVLVGFKDVEGGIEDVWGACPVCKEEPINA